MNVNDIVRMITPTPEVVASPHRLDEQIRWVHITDLANPAPYLRGGELILSNALWHRSAADAWAYAEALASRGSRALGLALFDQEEVPDGLVRACEEFEIVLLLLGDIPFMDVTEKVIAQILDDRRKSSVRSISLEQKLSSRIEDGDGISALIRTLEEAAQVPVWIVQRDGTVHSTRSVPLPDVHLAWLAGFGPQQAWRSATEITTPAGEQLTLVGLWADGRDATSGPPASLVFNGPLSVMREHVDAVTALSERYFDLLQRDGIEDQQNRRLHCGELIEQADTEREIEHELLDRLVTPNQTAGTISLIVTKAGEGQQEYADVLEAAVRMNGLEPAISALIGERIIVAARGQARRATDVMNAIYEDMAHVLGDELRLGLSSHQPGSPLSIGDLLAAATEAFDIASIPERRQRWADSSDVRPHLLLLATTPASTRSTLHAQTIAPLERYDSRHHSQLVHTLSTFLNHDCSWQRTASALHLHVNSLRYRIGRIEELTGKDLSQMGDKCDLFLALATVDENG